MRAKVLTLALGVAVLAVAARQWQFFEPPHKSTVTPLSVTYRVRSFYQGNETSSELFVRKLRSDGSFMQYSVYPDGRPSLVHVTDYTLGVSVGYDPRTKLMVRQSLPPRGDGWVPASCADVYRKECQGPVDETVLGYRTEKVAAPAFPDGVTIEFLVAPDLDFLMLKKSAHEGGELIEEWVATEIQIGEPDPTLFAIPNYEAVDRATYLERGSLARGRPASAKTLEKLRAIQVGKQPPCQGCK